MSRSCPPPPRTFFLKHYRGLRGRVALLVGCIVFSHCVGAWQDGEPERTRKERRRPAPEKSVATPTLQDLEIRAAGWQSKEEALQKEESALLQDFGKTLSAFEASKPSSIREASREAQKALAFRPVSDGELSAWVEAALKGESPAPLPQKSREEVIAQEKKSADRFYQGLSQALPKLDDASLLQLRFKMMLALASAHMQKEHLDLEKGVPIELLEYAEAKAREMRNRVNRELLWRGLTDE